MDKKCEVCNRWVKSLEDSNYFQARLCPECKEYLASNRDELWHRYINLRRQWPECPYLEKIQDCILGKEGLWRHPPMLDYAQAMLENQEAIAKQEWINHMVGAFFRDPYTQKDHTP